MTSVTLRVYKQRAPTNNHCLLTHSPIFALLYFPSFCILLLLAATSRYLQVLGNVNVRNTMNELARVPAYIPTGSHLSHSGSRVYLHLHLRTTPTTSAACMSRQHPSRPLLISLLSGPETRGSRPTDARLPTLRRAAPDPETRGGEAPDARRRGTPIRTRARQPHPRLSPEKKKPAGRLPRCFGRGGSCPEGGLSQKSTNPTHTLKEK